MRRAAGGRVTGNPGHDLFLEGMFDLFAQQTLRTGGGGGGFFDAVLLEAYWFSSASSLWSALRDARSSWTFALASVLFNATVASAHGTRLIVTEHGKSRSALLDDHGAPLTHGLPAAGLCADELYVRTHHVGEM